MKYYYYYEDERKGYYIISKKNKWYLNLLGPLKFNKLEFIAYPVKKDEYFDHLPKLSVFAIYPMSAVSLGITNWISEKFPNNNASIFQLIIMIFSLVTLTIIFLRVLRKRRNQKIESRIKKYEYKMVTFKIMNKKRQALKIFIICTLIYISIKLSVHPLDNLNNHFYFLAGLNYFLVIGTYFYMYSSPEIKKMKMINKQY